ncbi:Glycerol kinase [Weissella sp. DD23]|nr:Glycerol kinase [Weissella sp. DD23]
MINSAKETADLATLAREQHPEPIFLVPAFTGLGAPYWDQNTRGAMFGLTRATSKGDVVRATLESLAYQTRDVLEAMEQDTNLKVANLVIDGGAAANDYLHQFQADLINVPVRRPEQLETTALGAAYLAGLGVGFWENLAQLPDVTASDIKQPMADRQTEMKSAYQGWHRAVKAARMFPLQ